MISFLLKQWKLLLDIVLVVGLILGFTFWDPFHIFTKTELVATANMVTGVRNIGQIVTTEYYGEVISSWKEFKLNEFPEDTVSSYVDDLYTHMKHSLSTIDKRRKANDAVQQLKQQENLNTDIYNKFIAFLSTRFFNAETDRVYDIKKGRLKGNYEERVAKKLYTQVENEKETIKKEYKDSGEQAVAFQNYLDSIPVFIGEFYHFYSFVSQKALQKGAAKRKNIVFIGRGWIKAGFDFGKFNKNNFFYDKENKIIYLYNIKPKVLDVDINPWFIPQRKIKGFELVDYSGKVNFKDAVAVKKECKQKLLQQALKAGVIEQAQESGKEALKNFFSLLLNEPDIQVKFNTSRYDLDYAMLSADSLITINEALFIDSLYDHEVVRIDTMKSQAAQQHTLKLLSQFINKLKNLHFVDNNYYFNYYSIIAAHILSDSFSVSGRDFEELLKARDTLKLANDHRKLTTNTVDENSIWFTSGNFRKEFNSTLDLLKKEAVTWEGQETANIGDPKFKQTDSTQTYNGKDIVVSNTIIQNTDTTLHFYYKKDIVQHPYFPNDLYYNTAFEKISNDKRLTDTSQIAKEFGSLAKMTVYNVQLGSIRNEENQTILKALKNNFIYHKQLDPLKQFLAKADHLFETMKKQ